MAKKNDGPEIGIVIGSKSDLPLVKKVEDIFSFFSVRWEITIASAHRTPEDAAFYASGAADRGIKVLLAAAGLSAALPGVVAANTTLPVVGIPVNSGSLGGLDALLSVTQMPPGVPVASVGIDGVKNAALFAVRILSLTRKELDSRLIEWAEKEKVAVHSSRKELAGLPVVPENALRP